MRKRNRWITGVAFVGAVMLSGVCRAQVAPRDPKITKQQFQLVLSKLDMNGDFLLVGNLKGIFKEFVDRIAGIVAGLPGADGNPQTAAAKATMTKVAAFLDQNGFYALQGVGLSAVPRSDGTSRFKFFASLDPAAASLPLWRAVVAPADQRRRFTSLDLLPADTVLVQAGSGDSKQLWGLVKQGVQDIAPPPVAASFNAWIDATGTTLGTGPDEIIGTLGQENFFSLQLSSTRKAILPTGRPGGEPLTIPSPSLLFGVAVKDDTLEKVLQGQLTKKGQTLITTTVSGMTVHSLTLPVPLPFPLQLTFGTYRGMFLFGSNLEVVKDAVSAFENKNGMAATATFKKAFDGLPLENNGFSYMNPRFMEAIRTIQTQAMALGKKPNPAGLQFLKQFTAGNANLSTAKVVLASKDGIAVHSNSTVDGRRMTVGIVMLPLAIPAVVAAIAVPSFVQARKAAQRNACIANLRMIQAAKQQWALANNKPEGAPVPQQELLQYLPMHRMPACPGHGMYQINPVGQKPTCSIPRHRLR